MRKGFTLAEVMIALTILGFLFVLTITKINEISPDIDKARFKKAYVEIENTVSKLITDSAIYPGNEGFKNTEQVILQGTGETIGFNGKSSKFREGFKYIVNVMKDDIDCELYPGMTSSTGCFMNDAGIIYGIPNTDFELTGVVNDKKNSSSQTIKGRKYTPIVVYTNFKESQNPTLEKNGFIVGVSSQGRIKILYTVDCKNGDADKYLQCKAAEYLKSNTIRADKDE